jgi:hypothetical protein
MRRTACLALLIALLLPGCAPGEVERAELARALRMLSKAIAALDDERARLGASEQPALAGAVAELRLVLHQAERTAARLPDHIPADAPRDLDALRASTERLRGAASTGRGAELRALAEEVAAQAQETSGALRAVVDRIRPFLRPPEDDAAYLAGRVPTSGAVLAVRIVGALYTAAAASGLATALAARDALARRRRRLNGAVFAGLCALGLAATAAGAPAIAGLMTDEIAIPDGARTCALALARGAELERALRIAAPRAQRQDGGASLENAGGRPLSRRDLLLLVRGGSQRRLLERPGPAAPPEAGAARPIGADLLARDVRDLAAECVAFAATGEPGEEARYYHTLAVEYLGPPLACARDGTCGGPGG